MRWTTWALLCFLVGGCKTQTEGNLSDFEVGNEGFVRVNPVDPTQLILNGREFRFANANSYSMLDSKAAADKQLAQVKAMGFNALRMWGFNNGEKYSPNPLQTAPGVFPEASWQLLDYVIAQAGRAQIKLILPLANYWAEYGGIDLMAEWAGHPKETRFNYDREVFYADPASRKIYAATVLHMLNRVNTITGIAYKNDPTIMMWEPINEARCRSDPTGKLVADWLSWASKLIKDNAPLQLVGSGTEGFFSNYPGFDTYPWQAGRVNELREIDGTVSSSEAEGSYFELDCKIPTIDLCSIHAWPFQWFIEPRDRPDLFMAQWIDEHIKFMKSSPAYRKPLYLAEFNLQIIRAEGAPAFARRDAVLEYGFFDQAKGRRVLRKGIAGVGVWNITAAPEAKDAALSFDIFCPEDRSSCAIIQEFNRLHTR